MIFVVETHLHIVSSTQQAEVSAWGQKTLNHVLQVLAVAHWFSLNCHLNTKQNGLFGFLNITLKTFLANL